jgi:hypothetical protein
MQDQEQRKARSLQEQTHGQQSTLCRHKRLKLRVGTAYFDFITVWHEIGKMLNVKKGV